MSNPYDQYYKTENLFGDAYPELIALFSSYPKTCKILDLGCGQGRDAIALSRMGFEVTGIDSSNVGIEQLIAVAKKDNLKLIGHVMDIYTFEKFEGYDFILLDSMFHFTKKDRNKEVKFIQKILSLADQGTVLVFCIQDTGTKVKTLIQALGVAENNKPILDQKFEYTFTDKESGHSSTTPYRMIVISV